MMTDSSRKNIQQRIRQWKAAGIVMEQARRDMIDHASCRQAIEALNDAFESALLHTPPRLTSGLVEQQAWFSRMPR